MGEETHDIVVIGGGIGGSAIASALAAGGLDVLLLEASETYADRVRGEAFTPWGMMEARRLGLEDRLKAAGAHFVRRMLGYDELLPPSEVDAAPVPMDGFAPDVPGMMTLAHPIHCQTLIDAAADAGADVRRNARLLSVEAGAAPKVTFDERGEAKTARARLVVGADGRPSATREAFGVPLTATPPRNVLGGLMIEDAHDWPQDDWSLGTEGEFCYVMFPQGNGRMRTYGFWPLAQRGRFAGPDAAGDYLAAFRLACCPNSPAVAGARPAGPMLSFLNNETHAERPFVEGGVLIGDAGGWSDPLIGCGLSSAYRDARMVSEILLGSDDWSPAAFAPYAEERNERFRRLAFIAGLLSAQFCEFGEAGRTRRRRWFEAQRADESMLAHLAANLAGPETQPPELFTPQHRAHVLGDAG
jgi:2-polyprenyl-6-methoxyphenol hydroxylase-like FAD-dependent oxidoreductase